MRRVTLKSRIGKLWLMGRRLGSVRLCCIWSIGCYLWSIESYLSFLDSQALLPLPQLNFPGFPDCLPFPSYFIYLCPCPYPSYFLNSAVPTASPPNSNSSIYSDICSQGCYTQTESPNNCYYCVIIFWLVRNWWKPTMLFSC